MPCVCNQKVERSHPKVQCTKCKEFFHLQCVNILPSDVEFLLNSDKPFICPSCAANRRKSIRSPPPPSVLDESVYSDFTGNELEIVNLPTGKSFAEQQQSTLRSIVNEIAAFRADNAHMFAVINALREDKERLISKTESLQLEIHSLKSKLRIDELTSAITLLTAEVNCLRENALKNSNCTCVNLQPNVESQLENVTATAFTADCIHPSSSTAAVNMTGSLSFAAAAAAAVNNNVNNVTRSNPLSSLSAPAPAAFTNRTTSTVASKFQPQFTAGMIKEAVNHETTNNINDAAVNDAVNISKRTERYKRSKLSNIVGSNENKELQVVVRMNWLHLSSFQPSISANDIIAYVVRHSKTDISNFACHRLVKKDTPLSAIKKVNFKLGVATAIYDKILSPDLWPSDVNVRPFRFFPREEKQQQSI